MRLTALLLLLPLAACGTDSGASLLDTGRWFGGGAAVVEEEGEPEGPILRLAQGRRGADARLIAQQGERRMWRTRAGVVVATDGVRVVATSGLPMMVTATRFDGPDPLAEPATLLQRSADARRVVDLMTASREPEGMRFGVTLQCRLVARPAENDLVLIVETCQGAGLGRIRNRFWLERESLAIQASEQWVGPGVAPLTIEHNVAAVAEEPTTAPAAN